MRALRDKKVGIIAAYKEESIDRINRVAFDYIEAIESVGGTPYIIPCNVVNTDVYIREMDAFIFPGGSDVDPSLYHEELLGSTDTVLENDQFLLGLLGKIIDANKPILGICKGMQLINVFFGGTLIQHLQNANFHDQYIRQYEAVDSVRIVKDSFLESIFGCEKIAINSLHHQAVGVLGDNLKISAVSEYDETIEGIEHVSLPIFGVQWHPECLKEQRRLFEWFLQLPEEISKIGRGKGIVLEMIL